MQSETLTDGLRRYKIGSKIRALRLKKKLGLVQLGEHTRSLGRPAVEDRARKPVPDTPHLAAHRDGIRRWARTFFRRER